MVQYPKPQPPVLAEPKRPASLNVNCCSQSFSNISGNKVTLKDINQDCKQTITNNDVKTVDSGTKGSTVEQAKAAVADKSTIVEEEEEEKEDYTLYIILAILVCISSCCSSIVIGGGGFFLLN
jgi:hypothetical protein